MSIFGCKISNNSLKNIPAIRHKTDFCHKTHGMELNKLDRQLKLMALLAGNTTLGINRVAQKLALNPRSVYRYLSAFREMGFIITHDRDIYRIDKNSPFFREISGSIMFSEDEAATVSQLLSSVNDNSTQIKNLRRKLDRLYNYNILENHDTDRRLADNISLLYEAIKQQLTVVLKSYKSLRGESVTDRTVEPYRFLNGNDDIRCYEISSQQNKTFKISRIGEVKLLDVKWLCEPKHENIYTDTFGFTDTPIDEIEIQLSPRAAALMREEYPQARKFMTEGKDGRSVFRDRVCSYLGATRFVFGLYNDVEVTKSPEFIAYLKEKAKDLTRKFDY